ncbi:MAG TPA: hypothetical protein VIJ77_03275 [Candidatus Tumulicola sp.]
MKKSIGILFSSLLAAGLLAGCNGSSSGNNNNGFGSNCGPAPSGFVVLYPRNGAPHIPSNNANAIFVASNPALPIGNAYTFFAVQSSGFQQRTSVFATYNGSIPNPHTSPPPGSTVYEAQFQYPIGPLQGVNLYWNDGALRCTPNVIVSSFSTGH